MVTAGLAVLGMLLVGACLFLGARRVLRRVNEVIDALAAERDS